MLNRTEFDPISTAANAGILLRRAGRELEPAQSALPAGLWTAHSKPAGPRRPWWRQFVLQQAENVSPPEADNSHDPQIAFRRSSAGCPNRATLRAHPAQLWPPQEDSGGRASRHPTRPSTALPSVGCVARADVVALAGGRKIGRQSLQVKTWPQSRETGFFPGRHLHCYGFLRQLVRDAAATSLSLISSGYRVNAPRDFPAGTSCGAPAYGDRRLPSHWPNHSASEAVYRCPGPCPRAFAAMPVLPASSFAFCLVSASCRRCARHS